MSIAIQPVELVEPSFESVPLGEVLSIDGQSVAPGDLVDGTVYIGLESIGKGGVLDESITVQASELKSAKFAFDSRHVLFGKLRPNLGKVARPTGEGVCSTDIYPLLPGAHLDRGYLAHYLLRPEVIARAASRTTGVNLPRISSSVLKSFEIPLPPLPEQRRIAAILDQADELRAKRRRTFKILEELEGSIFQGLPERVPTSDWRTMPLSDAYWFQEGPGIRKWQFTDSGVKLLNVGNILKSGQLDLSRTNKHVSDFEAHGKYKHFLVDAGDFVVASSGISFDDDGLLRTRGAFVSGADLPLCMNTSTIRFKAKQGVSTLAYLRSWLSSKSFRVQISRLVTGSAQQNFGPSHLKQTEIALPPLWLQHQHEAQLHEISSVRQHHAAHLTKLDELFASLQHRAFTGQL